jgi:capsular exopolysaccharide synthesis family protein
VILVDADLRRPSVHRSLKMTMEPGLSDVLNNRADIQSVTREWSNEVCLKVITAGSRPANVTEVVGSKRIASILSELKGKHELIIIDAPPLIIADSYNLASRADGVIIVMEPGQTAHEQAKAIKEQLSRADAKIIGIVFNKISADSVNSYDDPQYRSLYSPKYYGDYLSTEKKDDVAVSRSKRLMDFFEHGKGPPEVSAMLKRDHAIKTQQKCIEADEKNERNNLSQKEKSDPEATKCNQILWIHYDAWYAIQASRKEELLCEQLLARGWGLLS